MDRTEVSNVSFWKPLINGIWKTQRVARRVEETDGSASAPTNSIEALRISSRPLEIFGIRKVKHQPVELLEALFVFVAGERNIRRLQM